MEGEKKKKKKDVTFLFYCIICKEKRSSSIFCFISSYSGFYVHMHISFSKVIPRNSNRNIIVIRQENN